MTGKKVFVFPPQVTPAYKLVWTPALTLLGSILVSRFTARSTSFSTWQRHGYRFLWLFSSFLVSALWFCLMSISCFFFIFSIWSVFIVCFLFRFFCRPSPTFHFLDPNLRASKIRPAVYSITVLKFLSLWSMNSFLRGKGEDYLSALWKKLSR